VAAKRSGKSGATEKVLDKALDEALKGRPDFVGWLLGQTKFAGRGGTYHWSRSNHPWCRMKIEAPEAPGGFRIVESETDVLAVFEAADGLRCALHFENKLANGSFTPGQPDLYPVRARYWMNKTRYKSYTDFETVLVAPIAFRERNAAEAGKFDRFIAHEEIAPWISVFGLE
jgi:hypothetical protein